MSGPSYSYNFPKVSIVLVPAKNKFPGGFTLEMTNKATGEKSYLGEFPRKEQCAAYLLKMIERFPDNFFDIPK